MSLPQTIQTPMASDRDRADLAAVVDALRSHDRFLVTTHENPDGDALGSLLAMKLALDQLGKDSVMVLHSDAPLPGEYGFMPLAELLRRWPDDVSERVLVALDCANESRIGDDEILGRVPLTLDIDHHHDNTRFGDVNLIVPDASSTGEVLRDLFRELGVELTPEISEALYTAIVTDTGRFQYANTTPKTFLLAAELLRAGADRQRVFQGVYESVQFAKLKLLARALDRAQVYEGGRIVISYLLRTDFAEVGAAEPYSKESSTTSARWKARRWRCSSASRLARAGRRGVSAFARASTSSTCRRLHASRVEVGIARPPAFRVKRRSRRSRSL